jgi:hypothetical protein
MSSPYQELVGDELSQHDLYLRLWGQQLVHYQTTVSWEQLEQLGSSPQ